MLNHMLGFCDLIGHGVLIGTDLLVNMMFRLIGILNRIMKNGVLNRIMKNGVLNRIMKNVNIWRASEASETLIGLNNGNRRYIYICIYI